MTKKETNTRFSLMKKGYNRYEVDDTINKLEKEVEDCRGQVENYRELNEQSSQQLMVIKEKYQKLVDQIEVREKAADDISRLALKEANRIIGSAQNNADTIVKEAITTARMMLSEINRLATEANDAKVDMQNKLTDLQNLLDQFEIFDTIDEKWLNN